MNNYCDNKQVETVQNVNYKGEIVHIPKFLYKYRSWSDIKHRELLLKGIVWFASPSSFEDVNDCHLREKIPKAKDFYRYLQRYGTHQLSRQQRRKWSRKKARDKKQHIAIIQNARNEKDKRIGILSLTANETNEKMWETYANKHKGFCVELNMERVLSAMTCSGGPVDYREKLPIVESLCQTEEDWLSIYYTKLAKYSFEEEYRLHKMVREESERSVRLTSDCFSKVILGNGLNDEEKNEAVKLIENGINCTIEEEQQRC